MYYRVDESQCTGCGDCIDACPVAAIRLVGQKACISEEECIECGACQAECREVAIFEVERSLRTFHQ